MSETDTDTATDTRAERAPQDKAREGLEHLQAAARELIQAARAMLDAAEDLVNDPEAVASVAGTVGALGDLVRRWAGSPLRRPDGDTADPAEPADDGRAVERITIM